MPNPKKPRILCPICGKEPYRSFYKYCSNACQQEYQYRQYIEKWKSGKVTGLQSIGVVNPYIKKYLRRKFNDTCMLCGWAQKNPITNKVPLVADHIDGDWRNNVESNLRLICPNCDSLTPTYSGLNRGKGRPHRTPSRRAAQAKLLLTQRSPLS
ncbi:MAG TPA: HNH endonuclease [Candidatus Paceibacterota bacterium]|nr:HNH endonuclease [Candidatus Paceibacterota bacterium]